MHAIAVILGRKDSARLIEAPNPTPQQGEALIKVLQVGVDGTDWEINEGLYGQAPAGEDYLILGHESLGRVEEAVGNLSKGDLVVGTVRRPCPQNCMNCAKDEVDICLTGDYQERGIKGIHGFMSEYYVEDPRYLLKLPPQLKDIGVLLEPLSVVEKGIHHIHAIQQRMKWEPKTALVLGAGPIGLFATIILSFQGLDVYTLDRKEKDSPKAKFIESVGAHYLDGREFMIPQLPQKLGNIDIIFEATGNSSVALQGMSAIGTNGIMCLTGVTGGNKTLEICADCLNMQMVLGNKTVFGTVNANRRDFKKGIEHMLEFEEKWPGALSSLITRKVKLPEFNQALDRQPGDIKVVIEVD